MGRRVERISVRADCGMRGGGMALVDDEDWGFSEGEIAGVSWRESTWYLRRLRWNGKAAQGDFPLFHLQGEFIRQSESDLASQSACICTCRVSVVQIELCSVARRGARYIAGRQRFSCPPSLCKLSENQLNISTNGSLATLSSRGDTSNQSAVVFATAFAMTMPTNHIRARLRKGLVHVKAFKTME
jgi:hypothetical protein